MNKARFEAYTDAIIAIVVTLLVLEVPKPEGPTFHTLLLNWRSYFVYIITFLQIMAVWYNHHNLLKNVSHLNHRAYLANTIWILMLSLSPFATSWVSDYPDHWQPEMFYIGLWICWSLAFTLLENTLKRLNPNLQSVSRYTKWLYPTMAIALIAARIYPLIGIGVLGTLTIWLIVSPMKWRTV